MAEIKKKASSGVDIMGQAEKKTDIHLIMALVISIFSLILIIVTCMLSWEMWTIPMIVIGLCIVWAFHIGKIVSSRIYEYSCAGMILAEVFFYGIHAESFFDVPVIVCVLLFMLSMMDKKILLHLLIAVYLLAFFYQCVFLHTVTLDMSLYEYARLVIGILGIVSMDIIGRHEIDKRSRRMEKIGRMALQLESAKRQNADFLSNISHELRTPINMVTGISEVAMNKNPEPKLMEDIQSIKKAGRRLANQIDNILDYTEIVGDTLVPINGYYIMSSVINDVVTMISMQDKGDNLDIVFDMEPNLPYALYGDEDKIGRIIKILLDNAIKFTKEGGVYIHVGFREESYGINLDIDICDTGIGMTNSQIAHVCEDFYQVDSGRSRNAGGLGLGLSIVNGLLSAIGGFIYFESEIGKGLRVHVSIPQKVEDARPSMELENPDQIRIACYLKADKYSRKEVKDYYDSMIGHMVAGFGIEGYRLYHFEELERLQMNHHLTHLFIAQEEYEENTAYYEEVGKTICVVVIANKKFSLQQGSRMALVYKPVNQLVIANLLNGDFGGHDILEGVIDNRPFTCDGIHALVVDDEQMNLVVAQGILNSYGMKIDTCLSGEEAVQKCINTEYDLIFLDHMMPGIDGVETLKRIREIKNGVYQKLPIIALTANAVSGAREMFKNEGFTEFVPKPIERTVLERALRRALPEQKIHYSDLTKETENDVEVQETEDIVEVHETGDSVKINEMEDGVQVYEIENGVGVGTEDTVEIYEAEDAKEVSDMGQDSPAPDTSSAGGKALFDKLKQAGINVELGLMYCGDLEDFYIEMLQIFFTQSKEKQEEIISLYEAGDWRDYAVKVHALKSTSKTIGAEQLSEQALNLEMAGKEDNESFIRENHPNLLKTYQSLCSLIAECLEIEDSGKGGDVQ